MAMNWSLEIDWKKGLSWKRSDCDVNGVQRSEELEHDGLSDISDGLCSIDAAMELSGLEYFADVLRPITC